MVEAALERKAMEVSLHDEDATVKSEGFKCGLDVGGGAGAVAPRRSKNPVRERFEVVASGGRCLPARK